MSMSKLCNTCIYRNNVEQLKPCIIYRDDCELYEEEGKSMSYDLISREQLLKVVTGDSFKSDFPRMSKALVGIIKALPSVTQKSETVTEFADRCRECGAKYGKLLKQKQSGDLISRQAVIDITWEEPSYTDALNVLTEVRDKVKTLPSVTPQKTQMIDKSNLTKSNTSQICNALMIVEKQASIRKSQRRGIGNASALISIPNTQSIGIDVTDAVRII